MLQQKEGPRGESNPKPRRYTREIGPLIYKREGTSHQAHFALNSYAQFIHLHTTAIRTAFVDNSVLSVNFSMSSAH